MDTDGIQMKNLFKSAFTNPENIFWVSWNLDCMGKQDRLFLCFEASIIS